jgi:hypothetical protein
VKRYGVPLGTAARALKRGYKNPVANPKHRTHRGRARRSSRRSYSRRPSMMRGMNIKRYMSASWLTDAATVAIGVIGSQKVAEQFKQTGWIDVFVTLGVGILGGAVAGGLGQSDAGRNIALGGGAAAAMKALAQFPQFNELVSKGSIVIGGSGGSPARPYIPIARRPGIAPLRRL